MNYDPTVYETPTDLSLPENLRRYMQQRDHHRTLDPGIALPTDTLATLSDADFEQYTKRCSNWNNLITVNTPDIRMATNRLSKAVRIGTGGADAQVTALVTGRADAGKSTLTLAALRPAYHAVMALNGSTTVTGDPRTPVVRLAVRGGQRTAGYARDWRKAIGDPNFERDKAAVEFFIDDLNEMGVRVIIVEDAHRIDGNGVPGSSDVWETLTLIAKRVDAVVVMEWTTEQPARALLAALNQTRAAQIASRLGDNVFDIRPMTAPRFTAGGEPKSGPFISVLKTYEQNLALAESQPRDLTNRTVATMLYDHTDGALGGLSRSLVSLADDAIVSGENRITPRLVQDHVEGRRTWSPFRARKA
jgi:hypothetical protein